MHGIYNKHYITIRDDGAVIDGWSDGLYPKKDTTDAICINDKGGYQFRLTTGGEENPAICTTIGIPLYKWDGSHVIPRTEEEVTAERASIPAPPPSVQQQLRADVDYIAIMTGVSL